jgi:phospholipid transport system substrate-binding protein
MIRSFCKVTKGEKMTSFLKVKRGNMLACIILILAVFFLLPPLFAEAEQRPEQTIQTFNATLLETMKEGADLGYKGRYALLAPVVEHSFALSFMGDVSLGKYRKTLDEKQHLSFLKTYTEWTIATYAGRFDRYSGERFEIASESKPDRGTVRVISRLIKADGKEVEFTYLLRNISGNWRVVDIHILGVSQLALTRAQFTDIIKKKGLGGLISMLQEKIKDFSQGKGE